MEVFREPRKIEEVNDTYIALIPKAEAPKNFGQFKLISLCNVTFKIVRKIIAARFKGLMAKRVGPTQCSFIPGRLS